MEVKRFKEVREQAIYLAVTQGVIKAYLFLRRNGVHATRTMVKELAFIRALWGPLMD